MPAASSAVPMTRQAISEIHQCPRIADVPTDANSLGVHLQVSVGLRQLILKLRTLTLPLITLRRKRIELGLKTRARLDHEFDLRFQTPDLGVGLIQRTLSLVHAITRRIMGLTHVLQLGLDMAQSGRLLFEISLRLVDVASEFFLLGLGFVLAQ